jgi:predicted nucleotidyltransferase
VLLLRHASSGTPLEVSLAWLPFEREALGRATVVDFGGVHVPVAQAEDLLVYKAIAWRDRDRADVERLLVRYAHSIDLQRVRALIEEFARVLEAPERLAEFDAMVRRASSPPR